MNNQIAILTLHPLEQYTGEQLNRACRIWTILHRGQLILVAGPEHA